MKTTKVEPIEKYGKEEKGGKLSIKVKENKRPLKDTDYEKNVRKQKSYSEGRPKKFGEESIEKRLHIVLTPSQLDKVVDRMKELNISTRSDYFRYLLDKDIENFYGVEETLKRL